MFAVVILAGGEGRRIGGGKPWLRLGRRAPDRPGVYPARSWSDRVANWRSATAAQVGSVPVDLLSPTSGLSPGPLGGLDQRTEVCWARDGGTRVPARHPRRHACSCRRTWLDLAAARRSAIFVCALACKRRPARSRLRAVARRSAIDGSAGYGGGRIGARSRVLPRRSGSSLGRVAERAGRPVLQHQHQSTIWPKAARGATA